MFNSSISIERIKEWTIEGEDQGFKGICEGREAGKQLSMKGPKDWKRRDELHIFIERNLE